MDIYGLQKMTLLDFPGRVACTVFLAGCGLRCPYCHNAELVGAAVPPLLDDGQLLAFLEKRRGLLDGVAVTGGEPLLRPELPELLARIRALGYQVKLDTNGCHPEALRQVVAAGLVDYVAKDVKNSPARYADTVGLPDFDPAPVVESAAFLLGGAVDYEFRTTAVAELHDDQSFRDIGRWLAGARRYFIQCFVQRDTVPCRELHPPEKAQLERWAELVQPWIPSVALRGV